MTPCAGWRAHAATIPLPGQWDGCARQWQQPCFVYHLTGTGSEATSDLYVGMADDWRRRLKEHARSKLWWPRVETLSVYELCCRWHAREDEAVTICDLNPLYNVHRPSHQFPGWLAARRQHWDFEITDGQVPS